MPHFDIVKKSEVKNTYRVARVMADYDVKADHANEHFTGEIVFPDDWHIGCIVGGSGTGKTPIARELFGDYIGGGVSIYRFFRIGRYAEGREHGRDRKNVLCGRLRKRPVMAETV